MFIPLHCSFTTQQLHILYMQIQSYIATTCFGMSLYLYVWRAYLLVSRVNDLIQRKPPEQKVLKYLFQFKASCFCNKSWIRVCQHCLSALSVSTVCQHCSWKCSYLSRNKIFTETLSLFIYDAVFGKCYYITLVANRCGLLGHCVKVWWLSYFVCFSPRAKWLLNLQTV
jgi:hypothetical protein